MALFLGAHLHDLHRAGSLSTAALATWMIVLVLYVLSIAGGRLYTGMHEFMGISIGIMLGIIGWVLQRMVMPEVERWVTDSGRSGTPFISCNMSLLTFLRSCFDCGACLPVNQYPSPVDDCPCFEDAIAFIFVILGIITSI